MRRTGRVHLAASLLLVALAALSCATPVARSGWIRVQTPNFELVSSADESTTAEIADGLELFRASVAFVTGGARVEPRIPTLVYVFGDTPTFERFAPRPDLGGFMLQRPHRNFLVIDAGRREGARTTAYHEYLHFVLRNGAAVPYPAWYDEGLSDFLSTIEERDDDVVVGLIPQARGRWILYGSPLSLRRIMTAESTLDWSSSARSRFYAQSWALTHFLFLGHRVGFPRRDAELRRYLALLKQGEAPEEACENAFGVSFEELERDYLAYTAEGRMPYTRFARSRLDVPSGRRVTPLPDAERGVLLGELALALGERWREEARRWLAWAAYEDPASGRAQALLALALGPDDPESERHAARAIELAPDDAEVRRAVGESRLDRAAAESDPTAAVRLADEARAHFRRSIELDPTQVAALAGLGTAQLVVATGDPEEALTALETAHARLPADRSIALALGQLRLEAGARREARQLLASLPARSHGDPAGRDERDRLERARSDAGLVKPAVRAPHLERRLDVETPEDGARLRGLVAWVDVAGRGGAWEAKRHDVVIAIDQSTSTLQTTGADLDGDGIVGQNRRRTRSRNPATWISDLEDSVVFAELEAARSLIRQFDPGTTRVGVLAFAGGSELLASLGAPADAMWAVDFYEPRVDISGTSLAVALRGALREMVASRDAEERRQRTVVLLSDGQPTVPSEAEGRRAALELAEQLGEFGIPIHAFALGESALREPEFYRSLAEKTDGRFVPVEDPADAPNHLAEIHLTGLERVTLRNATTDAPGRAVRVFADGSFDGYVPVVPGENRIEVTAYIEGWSPLTTTRRVFFERPSDPGPADREAAEALRRDLEKRALELDLLNRMKRRRAAAQQRRLEMEAEPPTEPAPETGD